MGKLLFWIAVIIVVMFAIRLINQKKSQQQAGSSSTPAPAQTDDMESMVRCEHCGVHLPRSDAVLMNERLWCSTEHAQRGPKPR